MAYMSPLLFHGNLKTCVCVVRGAPVCMCSQSRGEGLLRMDELG